MSLTLAVIAKAPEPGRSKTRLCPPLSPDQAATLAVAALADTLDAVLATPADRRVLILDGEPGPWLPRGIEVTPQRGSGLDERLANALTDIGGSVAIIGMDTPQLSSRSLASALGQLQAAPAILGPTLDGGYWIIGLRRPDPRALLEVPMSTSQTFRLQRARLLSLGLAVDELESLRDVDTYADALEVAAGAPRTRFAGALAAMRIEEAA